MNIQIKEHRYYGKTLFADNGILEIGIPLEFGLRIGHVSFVGEENLLFEQPNDMTQFSTADGWRLHGGHRLWLAPESTDDYHPDNDPIEYTVEDDALILTQREDPRLHVQKTFVIRFDQNRLRITHRVKNLASETLHRALWSISTLAAGGVAYLDLPTRTGGLDHWTRIATWDYTNLGDPRATYTREQIRIEQAPFESPYKIGVGHPLSPVRYENGNTVFKKYFDVQHDRLYPDANVSLEVYVSSHMLELESLAPLVSLAKNEEAEHTEVWELLRKS